MKYQKEVEDKTLQFLSHSLKFDLSGGDSELNLDMTLEEAEFLALASDDIKAKAESGELLALTTWMRDFTERKQVLLNTIYDKLDRTLQQCDLMENEIIEDLWEESEELGNLRTSSGNSIINDLSGIREGGRSFENLILVEGFVSQNPKADDVAAKADTLRQLMAVRGAVLRAKVEIQEILLDKETEADLSRADYLETLEQASICANAAGSCEVTGETHTLLGQVEKARESEMNELFKLLKEHDGKQAEMNDTFANFCDYSKEKSLGQMQINDNFRIQLLKYLAGNIYLKDHRNRYQTEQFDRFVSSYHIISTKYQKRPLRELAQDYARLIDAMVDASHDLKCPKIDANYDDFQQKTVMPVNATVFYYFFSTNRQGKTFAQWILSTVRYPNERMRRAYMRFFS